MVNLPHDVVVVAGDQPPSWMTGVTSIQLGRKSSRFDDAEANVRAGLIAINRDWAYIFHDDMIVVRPVDWIAPANRGLLSSYRGYGGYNQRARAVNEWLRRQGILTPVNFNIHLPFLVDAEKYLRTNTDGLPSGFGISVYGNLSRLRTRTVIDPKVTAPGGRPHPSWPVWSLSDRSFKTGLIGRMLRDAFPRPGPYEN